MREQRLIREGSTEAYVHARVRQKDGIHTVEIALSAPGKKAIRVNGSPIRRMSELMGHMMAVIFSPEDLLLIREGPAARRRFTDSTLSQIYPGYCLTLQQYAQALSERNDLLRTLARTGSNAGLLDVWDEQLSKLGSSLTETRIRFFQELSQEAARTHERLTQGKEELALSYRPSVPEGSREEMRYSLLEMLMKNRERDLRMQATQAGPHRDDLQILLNGKPVRIQASQGQIRTCAIALKLAQLRWMKDKTGETPILLLDDVYSELDSDRRRLLQDTISTVQTLLTCTDMDRAALPHAPRLQVLRVRNGKVEPAPDGP